MPPLTDPERVRHYTAALSGWSCSGYVNWTARAQEWVRENLPGVTPREVARLMWEHVQGGGRIDEARETRPEWCEHEFHHDLRLRIGDRDVYVETAADGTGRGRFDDSRGEHS